MPKTCGENREAQRDTTKVTFRAPTPLHLRIKHFAIDHQTSVTALTLKAWRELLAADR